MKKVRDIVRAVNPVGGLTMAALVNRYAGSLRTHNHLINSLGPPYALLRNVAAYEIIRAGKGRARVLEIGCGQGDSALPMLYLTQVTMDLLDVSSQMIEDARKLLKEHAGRTHFYCGDAIAFLRGNLVDYVSAPETAALGRAADDYAVIYSSFTVHNFTWSEKLALFKAIYGKLHRGGMFVLDDLILEDGNDEQPFEDQIRRYKKYLPGRVSRSVIAHARKDARPEYRMHEWQLINTLRDVGFQKPVVVDRVGCHALLIARK